MTRTVTWLGLGLAVLLLWPATTVAGERVIQTFDAPFDEVFTAVEAALDREGWGLDHADRPLGLITTRSRRVAGDDDGAHAKNRRVRLRLTVIPAGAARTVVAVERELFARERVLWMERDEPLAVRDPLVVPDRAVERRVLAAIGRAF